MSVPIEVPVSLFPIAREVSRSSPHFPKFVIYESRDCSDDKYLGAEAKYKRIITFKTNETNADGLPYGVELNQVLKIKVKMRLDDTRPREYVYSYAEYVRTAHPRLKTGLIYHIKFNDGVLFARYTALRGARYGIPCDSLLVCKDSFAVLPDRSSTCEMVYEILLDDFPSPDTLYR